MEEFNLNLETIYQFLYEAGKVTIFAFLVLIGFIVYKKSKSSSKAGSKETPEKGKHNNWGEGSDSGGGGESGDGGA